jgi:hypothetical protein
VLGLQLAGCVELGEDGEVSSTAAGKICSFYYLRHETIDLLRNHMNVGMDLKRLLLILSSCPEFDDLPVRQTQIHLKLFQSQIIATPALNYCRWSLISMLLDFPTKIAFGVSRSLQLCLGAFAST